LAARIDFDYLHHLARGPWSHAVLERIEADREVLLSGGSLPVPGEPLTLSFELGPEELAPGKAPRPVHLILRSDLAPASLDTFLEIFRDHAHTLLPGFCGEEGGTVVDLGANEGFYTLRMKLLDPELRVAAAEPLRENAELFRGNLEANGVEGVTLLETAVTGHDGTVRIETLPHVGTVASTDILAFPRPWIKAENIRPRRVTSRTLGTLLETAGIGEADILKMDVEGGEREILSGSREILRRFRRIVVECHGEDARRDIAEIVESRGFRCVYAEGKRSGDLYFLRE
jgi:FkbM family methyltransferase